MRIVGRRKVTVSLSSRCLQLIDKYAETTGFESRSRVIEEVVFAISEFQEYRRWYTEKRSKLKENPNPSANELMDKVMILADLLSKFGGILDRFDRFPSVPQTQENEPIKHYRLVPPEGRSQNVKPEG